MTCFCSYPLVAPPKGKEDWDHEIHETVSSEPLLLTLVVLIFLCVYLVNNTDPL